MLMFPYSWLFPSPTSPYYFTPDSAPGFPDTKPWLSSIFNSLPFSLFIVDNFSSSQNLPSSSVPFHQPLLHSYIKQDAPLDLQVDTSIINLRHLIP